jgi:hypothetical protein
MMEEADKVRQHRLRDRDQQETELNNVLVSVSEKEFKVLSAELDLIGQDWSTLSQASPQQALKLLENINGSLELERETKAFIQKANSDMTAKRLLGDGSKHSN